MNPRLTSRVESMHSPAYRAEQRELAAEWERMERTDAALQVDALLDRSRQYATVEAPAPVSPWVFWPFIVGCSGALTFGAWELATRVLPMLWRLA